MSNIKTNLPNITFMFREGDEATEDGGCPIGGEFVAKTTTDLFAGKRSLEIGRAHV